MRIHSDSIESLEVRKAARLAGVQFTRFSLHGSRSREAAFDVILTGSSPRNQNFSRGDADKAATWDEWGHFLGTLFALDPAMVTPYYSCADDFHWQTGARFHDFDLSTQHAAGHRWCYSGDSVTGSYSVHECKCGAIRRFLHRQTWAEFTQDAA